MTDHFDVLVIGSGAGGGTLTHALASTGKRILLLERGDFMPREIENWSSKSLLVNPWSISERPIRARSGKAEEGGALGFVRRPTTTQPVGMRGVASRPGVYQQALRLPQRHRLASVPPVGHLVHSFVRGSSAV